MNPLRVLVVDDAAVVRRILRNLLLEDEEIGQVETAPNGRIALEKMSRHLPDIAIVDVEMPEMDGITAVRQASAAWPNLPLVMFSRLTERGAVATLEALACGAVDYVTKPAGNLDAASALQSVRETLIPRVKAIARASSRVFGARPQRPAPRAATPRRRLDVVVIGASTGGVDAVPRVLQHLPEDFAAPVLLVQHMHPVFTGPFTRRLNDACRLLVAEAEDGEALRPGRVYVGPGGCHVEVTGRQPVTRVLLHDGEAVNFCRPSVDPLFSSAARVYGEGAVGVVLSGMGRDGLEGARAIHAAGGRVLAQDRETSVVWGMPGAVVEAGIAHMEIPADVIGPTLLRWSERSVEAEA